MAFALATSHHIEELPGGLLCKDLADAALVPQARGMKPAFVHDARREPAVYRRLLGPAGVGPPCIASGPDWVVLERLDAVPLWQVGDADVWVAVAAWVAGMHRRLALAADGGVPGGVPGVPGGVLGVPGGVPGGVLRGVPVGVPLLVHDAALYAAWRERAGRAEVPAGVLAAHERASAVLAAAPATLLHGDLYPSNVLVAGCGLSVWPVDWELAGLGPAVLDVAALTAGSGWDPATREAMARAYFAAAGGTPQGWPAWSAALAAARLHLCVQWLGWAPGWTPPPEHRHDWLAEALELAARL